MFLLISLPMVLHITLAKDKNSILLQIVGLLFELNSVSFLHAILGLRTKWMFNLSSISISLEFRSVNHTPISGNSELKVFKNLRFLS